MLETGILEQLKSVYQSLENEITLVVAKSHHPNQQELLDLVNGLKSTSEKILVDESSELTEAPKLTLLYQGQPTGITFIGVPGGHEFTSLVLAILNADGKGKLPDEMIINRIKRLRSGIELRTYISLSCENCPEVVQALNLMSLFNPSFKHTMIDGAVAQDEVTKLNIQGVPSVMSGDKLISSGKIGLVDLISKLEQEFGIDEPVS